MANLLTPIFDAFENNHESLWLVGGAVRDLIIARDGDFLRESALKHPNLSEKERKYIVEDMKEAPSLEGAFWDKVVDGLGDIDFATSAHPEKSLKILQGIGLSTFALGIKFGTVAATMGKVKLEVTTFRVNEVYKEGSRKPTVTFGDNIKDDLARRDFCMNAIAMDRDLVMFDPFFGHMDIVQGVFWTPLNAHTSFRDDPLRMLRACRFFARELGSPSWDISKAMKTMKKEIHTVSSERIAEEMTKILTAQEPKKGLKLLEGVGLLAEIFPELQVVVDFKTKRKSKDLWDHTLKVISQTPCDPVLRWSALTHDIGKPAVVREKGKVTFHGHEEVGAKIWEGIASRLKFSKEFKRKVSIVIAESGSFVALADNYQVSVTDTAIRRFVRKVGKEHLERIFQFAMADMTTANKEKEKRMKKALTDLKKRMDKLIEEDGVDKIKLAKGTGLTLMSELGLKGKALGDVMKELTQMLVDGKISLQDDMVVVARKVIEGG